MNNDHCSKAEPTFITLLKATGTRYKLLPTPAQLLNAPDALTPTQQEWLVNYVQAIESWKAMETAVARCRQLTLEHLANEPTPDREQEDRHAPST